jgi:hypothetical protein
VGPERADQYAVLKRQGQGTRGTQKEQIAEKDSKWKARMELKGSVSTRVAKEEEEDRARPVHLDQPEEGQSKERDLREDRFRRLAIAWRDNLREKQE